MDGLESASLGRRSLLAMMLLAFLVNLTAYPASNGLLPYVAPGRSTASDATGLGWLVASFRLAVSWPRSRTVAHGGSATPGARDAGRDEAVWHAAILGFGHAGSLGPGMVALVDRRVRAERRP